MFANAIMGHKNLEITSLVMKKVFTLLKVAVLLSLLVLNKNAKDKKLALETEVKQQSAAVLIRENQVDGAEVFLPFANPKTITLAQ